MDTGETYNFIIGAAYQFHSLQAQHSQGISPMAYALTNAGASFSQGRIARVFTSAFTTITTWNDARVTRKSLSKLSARELEDIGLSFGDIDAIAARSDR